jgi:ribosomal protein L23
MELNIPWQNNTLIITNLKPKIMKKAFTKLMVLIVLTGMTVKLNSQTPVAYWKFDETSGTTAKEEISNLTSTITNNTENPFVQAAKGNGIDFSKFNADGKVEVTSYAPVEFTTGSFSISAVVKLDRATTTEQDIVAKGLRDAAVDGHWYALYISGGATQRYTFAVDDNVTKTDVKYDIPAGYDGWVHLVAVKDATSDFLYIYANGAKVVEKADATDASIESPTYPLSIGNNNEAGGKYNSIIDEVKIFNVALTETEISTMFNSYGINPNDGSLNTTGIKNFSSQNIEVYPNPASEKIMLKNANDKVWANIYSVTGKLVKTVQLASGEKEIDIKSLNNGFYYITVLNSKNKIVTKGSFIKL